MADNANNFASNIRRAWEHGGPETERDAVIRAEWSGATRIGPFANPDYVAEPGDLPASVWKWPDGSQYIIFDNGSGIRAVRRRGCPR